MHILSLLCQQHYNLSVLSLPKATQRVRMCLCVPTTGISARFVTLVTKHAVVTKRAATSVVCLEL